VEKHAIITSIVGRRGQVTVPRAIRHALSLQPGDRVAFIRRGDEVILQPLPHTLLDLRGSVAVHEPQDVATVREQVLRERARKVAERDT